MREAEYSEAAVEVLDILNHTNKDDVKKIPQSFIKFLTDISSKSYRPKFNHELPINGFNLKNQTKELLGFIYITWWCNKEEHERYKNVIHENNMKKEKIKETYNVNDIFKNKKENKIIQNENVMEKNIVEYKKENIFKKFLNKILSFLILRKGIKFSMIDKELIELQKGCSATCVVIQDEDCKELDSKVIVNADSNDSELLTTFKEKISNKEELDYFIISEIDKLNESLQNKYYQIVKDREFFGIKLPKDMIIVLTVKNREGLKNIAKELYNFCVIAF